MRIPMTSIQKKIYLDCIINFESQSRNIINTVSELVSITDAEKFRVAFVDVLNLQPLLKSNSFLKDGDFYFELSSDISCHEIPIIYDDLDQSVEKLKNRLIFKNSIGLDNSNRLFSAEIICTKNKMFLLWSCHHLIFDAFSGFYVISSSVDRYVDKIDIDNEKERIIDSLKYAQTDLKSRKETYAIEYYTNKLKKVDIEFKEKNTEKIFRKEIQIESLPNKKYESNTKSAIILYAVSEIMMKELNIKNLIIGVPVPNRNKKNKKLVSCLVNMMPIFIENKNSRKSNVILDIKKQLLKNILYQDFDFTTNFRQAGSFLCSFSYYPSKLEYVNDGCKISCQSLFSPLPPTPVHIMMDDTSKVVVESNFSEEIVKKIVDKIQEEFILFYKE